MYKIILPMLMGCGAFNATNDNENIGFLEKNTSILLENDPNIKGFIKKFEKNQKIFKEEITDNTLCNLIEEYKNALDDAAKDSDVKRCLDAYNEAFLEKNGIICDAVNIILAPDKSSYLDPIESLIYNTSTTSEYKAITASLLDFIYIPLEDNPRSIRFEELIKKSENNNMRLTAAKRALDRALSWRFERVIALDQQLDRYYHNLSKTTYFESIYDHILRSFPRIDNNRNNNIISNLAQFTRFDHLKSYDFMINSKRELYQYLARLEAGSKEMRGAVADFRKTISGI